MKSIRVHALEGSMVSTAKGIEKLYEIHNRGKEDVAIYVLPPTRDPDLSFYRFAVVGVGVKANGVFRLGQFFCPLVVDKRRGYDLFNTVVNGKVITFA